MICRQADGEEQGAKVTALYNTTSDAINSDLVLCEAQQNGRLAAVQCDVTDEEAVQRAFDRAAEQIGQPAKVLVGRSAFRCAG